MSRLQSFDPHSVNSGPNCGIQTGVGEDLGDVCIECAAAAGPVHQTENGYAGAACFMKAGRGANFFDPFFDRFAHCCMKALAA